ncbi:DUF1481 domain-containing protein [Vibrio sp. 10N.261.46.E12]|uniref:DUF1481 domain-containing protein n=1 Tax=unclassified Vibrio TaxID=2614977 RepID=UPI0009776703|nr:MULTISPECIES: DUF1481 domain-containing protein [unclassified Vibrio]OMO37489.1 peptidylprolyl isomerase [Vibrio sp. 10N.261.45.E1]PMJ36785.1 peptidylprolyl isomerase [Vibrio sp. 10N.286.45.B6]PML92299.1 peptidylprolyl isomerase [Vibrio sp. 10N.261.49.E11]PMM74485.1 peptidylprolyl isomerase [Vibrio sp. 10N.261.46.F12]PMM87875.1 peptidylprolyl isomerase [Vibrio sp. 10N.261.46.E8]
MKKAFLLVSLLSTFLIGCSSTSPRKNLEQFETHTGGQVMGDATSFYWVTNKLTQPHTSADYVTVGDYGWYQTDYAWSEGVLREFIREGEQRNSSNELVPYRVHVRFNKSGEAVYQQYRIDSKILPIQAKQLENYQKEAKSVLETTMKQNDEGLRLVQGYWDGSSFKTCAGGEFDRIEFNQTLPSFVIDRLASVESYAAFLGNDSLGKMSVEELLMLAEDNHDCVVRPSLLKE